MRDMIKMVVVLTLLSSFSGGLLAAIRNNTMDTIESQQLKYDKAPAIQSILVDAVNDPMTDRFKLTEGEDQHTFFLGRFEDGRETIVFETYGSGFGGDLGLMVGVNLADDTIGGIGVTTHSETPGIGAKAKTDPKFAEQFISLSIAEPVSVKDDGGDIDALSGATITSKGVCAAVNKAEILYGKLKTQIKEEASKIQ